MKIFQNTMVRYFIVGIFNTFIAYGFFALFLWCKLHYTWATLLAGFSSVLVGYKFMLDYVFKNKSKYGFIKFICVFVFMYCFNIFIQSIFQKFFNDYISGAFGSFACALVSYFINLEFVFKDVTFHKKIQ